MVTQGTKNIVPVTTDTDVTTPLLVMALPAWSAVAPATTTVNTDATNTTDVERTVDAPVDEPITKPIVQEATSIAAT